MKQFITLTILSIILIGLLWSSYSQNMWLHIVPVLFIPAFVLFIYANKEKKQIRDLLYQFSKFF